jgi:hypothetical protein
MESFPETFNFKIAQQELVEDMARHKNKLAQSARALIIKSYDASKKQLMPYFIIDLSKYPSYTKVTVMQELLEKFPNIGYEKLDLYPIGSSPDGEGIQLLCGKSPIQSLGKVVRLQNATDACNGNKFVVPLVTTIAKQLEAPTSNAKTTIFESFFGNNNSGFSFSSPKDSNHGTHSSATGGGFLFGDTNDSNYVSYSAASTNSEFPFGEKSAASTNSGFSFGGKGS